MDSNLDGGGGSARPPLVPPVAAALSPAVVPTAVHPPIVPAAAEIPAIVVHAAVVVRLRLLEEAPLAATSSPSHIVIIVHHMEVGHVAWGRAPSAATAPKVIKRRPATESHIRRRHPQ